VCYASSSDLCNDQIMRSKWVTLYNYSQDVDCYLADTTCFEVNPCDSMECLTVALVDVFCKNQGTADPDDDY